MPKKHKRSFVKPVITPHHTLSSSGSRQNDQFRRSAVSSEESSVNDLISHLRRTQASSSSEHNPQPSGSARSFVSPRSVHPSLRNLLELPETPPPRPRPNARRTAIGGRPPRRTPGPPPPESWLSGASDASLLTEENKNLALTQYEEVIYRLERLPGAVFPGERDLVHTVLKSMALNWAWHLDYDGPFLSQLPSHLKTLLLSYIAVYARGQPLRSRMRGLKPLYLAKTDTFEGGEDDFAGNEDGVDGDAGTVRLDLSCALGHWINFKQLTKELVVSTKSAAAFRRESEAVPASWDEDLDTEDDAPSSTLSDTIPKSISQGLRFHKLRYLSLAHPHPAHSSWNSLLQLLSHLSTITHLSLAHWPAPTRTPNAGSGRVPANRSFGLGQVDGGTDMYSEMEDNWAEAAGILRQLSRYTYCLKWLDLEGCSAWLAALTWTGTDPHGRPYRLGDSGPEWNGSWRDIEWIGLGPGWVVQGNSDADLVGAPLKPLDTVHPLRSLASSIHAPAAGNSASTDLPWDVEEERARYRMQKTSEFWRNSLLRACEAHRAILMIRQQDRGKWLHASIGNQMLETRV